MNETNIKCDEGDKPRDFSGTNGIYFSRCRWVLFKKCQWTYSKSKSSLRSCCLTPAQ